MFLHKHMFLILLGIGLEIVTSHMVTPSLTLEIVKVASKAAIPFYIHTSHI